MLVLALVLGPGSGQVSGPVAVAAAPARPHGGAGGVCAVTKAGAPSLLLAPPEPLYGLVVEPLWVFGTALYWCLRGSL
jgi:hypothetical protein